MRTLKTILVGSVLILVSACSVKRYAVDTIGDLLASGDSVYESDDDIVLIGEALPFSLKLVESLLNESPHHVGLLLSAARGYVLYAYAYVHHEADVVALDDIDRARELRARARKLYLRAHGYAVRAMEEAYPGLAPAIEEQPQRAVAMVAGNNARNHVPLLYWTAASLGLAIAVSKQDASMLARLPEVEALLERALVLDESWDEGALHEFMVTWSAAQLRRSNVEWIRHHYERALALSLGRRASLFVGYAEAVPLPGQDRAGFRELLEKALAVDLDADPGHRLMNVIAQRRASWLLGRIDELFL
jgi:predicted anti-sigma-YlaC factor YlaD